MLVAPGARSVLFKGFEPNAAVKEIVGVPVMVNTWVAFAGMPLAPVAPPPWLAVIVAEPALIICI